MDETKKIQKVILEIFKVVSEICERNGISYYAICGTCLGAVRHKGFIPWDDDLDIAIPIEEFEKFMDVAKRELPEHLELYTPSTSRHNRLLFIKVIDNRTTLIENANVPWKDSYKGIWIDIMPMSGAPSSSQGQARFKKKFEVFKKLSYKTKTFFPKDGSILGKLSWVMSYPLRLLPGDFFWKRWFNWISLYPVNSAESVCLWIFGAKLIFPKKWFDDYVYLDFEDTKIRCPRDYNEFLTYLFGNYMEYPPEEKRISGHKHDEGVLDFHHSYKDYQSGKLSIN